MPSKRLGWMLPLVVAAAIASSGCLFFPYPHSATRNSHLSGRVIDDESGEPIAGALVELADSSSYYGDVSTLTDADGYFDLPPTQRRAYIVIVPLLPFDYFPVCSEELRVRVRPAAATLAGEPRYREQAVQVHSCPPVPLLGFGSPEPPNEEIRDDLGVLRLKRRTW